MRSGLRCCVQVSVDVSVQVNMDVRDVTNRHNLEKTRHSARRKPYIGAENRTFRAVINTFNIVIL